MRAIVLKLTLVAGCLLFLASGAAWAQTGNLEGTVIGLDGKPLKGAVIQINRVDVRGHFKVKTNKKGHYFHAGLPLGTYSVVCEVNGKAVDQMNGVRVTFGSSTKVDFNLQEVAKRQEALRRAAETGQLTEEQKRAMSPEQRKQLEEQIKKRAKAMKKNKALNDAFNTAMQAKAAKQWDAAIAAFEKAGEIDPSQSVIWANLAEVYTMKADTKAGAERQAALEKAIESWAKVVAMDPQNPAYHNNYALALAKAKKYEEAEAELTKAAELNPKGAGQYFYNLGAVLVNTGQMEPAGAAFKKAIEADPNYASAQFQYGMYLLSKAKVGADGSIVPVPGTIEALKKYLELEPNGPFAQSAQGAIQSLSGSVQTQYTDPNAKKRRKKK